MVEADTTLNAIISPDVIDVVQVDKLKSSFLVEDDNVGFSVPVIVSAIVGGKFA
jgi:hypothetical protein